MVEVTKLALKENYQSIDDYQAARIVCSLLYWISGKQAHEASTFLGQHWGNHIKNHPGLNDREMEADLLDMCKILVNTAYQDRKRPLHFSFVAVPKPYTPSDLPDVQEELVSLREELGPQLKELVVKMEKGDVNPRDILVTAVAYNFAANNNSFDIPEMADKHITMDNPKYADAAVKAARRLIVSASLQGIRFDRKNPIVHEEKTRSI